MFKFNSNHIMVGQIKQILNTFNLPSYKIYTKEYEQYFNNTGTEHPGVIDGLYIKDGKVQKYENNNWSTLELFVYNRKILNITKTLPITNNIYDDQTHEYLGNFLRFQRDYLGIDLMPLYNCFGKKVCNHLDIAVEKKTIEGYERKRHVFWSKDNDYTIYAIPIKFFQEYTIALDASCGVEMCCGFYKDYMEEFPEKVEDNYKYKTWSDSEQKYVLESLTRVDLNQIIINNTYQKFSELRFNNPLLWNKLNISTINNILKDCVKQEVPTILETDTEEVRKEKQALLDKVNAYRNQILKKENDLKLFIKIPIANKSSITILEGNYLTHNHRLYKLIHEERSYRHPERDENGDYLRDENGDFIYDLSKEAEIRTFAKWESKQNHFVTNYETVLFGEGASAEDTVTITNPEVEDREFNPISPLQLLMLNTGTSYPFADRLLEYLAGNVVTEVDSNSDNIKRVQKVMQTNRNSISLYGAWEGKMRNILYDYMMGGKPSGEQFPQEIAHDVLGYVDKDVEKFYTAWKHEYCRDASGHYIPLTIKEKVLDGDGNPVRDENGKYVYEEVQLYREIQMPLTEADKKLLEEIREFVLVIKDHAEIPMYREVYKPLYTVSNVDIYDGEEV